MFVKPFSALAAPADLMLATGSNVLRATSSNAGIMTLDLPNDEYGISAISSVGSVVNTLSWVDCMIQLGIYDTVNKQQYTIYLDPDKYDTDGASLKYCLDGTKWDADCYVINKVCIVAYSGAVPSPGSYKLSFDIASEIGYTINAPFVWAQLDSTSVQRDTYDLKITDYAASSGDFYASNIGLDITNIDLLSFGYWVPSNQGIRNIDITCRVNFKRSTSDDTFTAVGNVVSTGDYQSSTTSILSNIVSSFTDIFDFLGKLLSGQTSIASGIDAFKTNVANSFTSLGSTITNKLTDVRDGIQAGLDDVADRTESALSRLGNFVIDSIKGLFIPSDGYFSSLFDDLNEFFKERFGFLYTPIDLLIRFVNMIYSADASFTGIPFPEIKWGDHVLVESQTVGFDILQMEAFKNVQNILYFLTDLMMIGALLSLIHRKFEEVMQN